MQVVFVLSRPKDPRNVGAAARAIKTMGFSQLHIVGECDFKHEKALTLAHGAHDILESASHFSDLASATQGIDLLVGTTIRHRRLPIPYINSHDLPAALAEKAGFVGTVAVVFGCETTGLSNQELSLCDLVTTIPTAGLYPSLNLSQSVMVLAYELAKIQDNAAMLTSDRRWLQGPGDGCQLGVLKDKVRLLLKSLHTGDATRLEMDTIRAISRLGGTDMALVYKLCGLVQSGLEIDLPEVLEDSNPLR